MKKGVFLLLITVLTAFPLRSQDSFSCPSTTNKGNDFWLMFLYNHNYNSGAHPEEQRVYIIGDQSSSVNITNNNSSIFNATLNGPYFTAHHICGTNQQIVATVYEGGYHITSDHDVWVYANDYIDHNMDATYVLPTEALDTHYIVQDYPSNNDRGAEVGFVATQDNTTLTMTVPCNVLGTSITAGTTLNVNLNTGQTYMLMAVANGSFSGMEVTSNGKPFAMFVAGQNTAVPVTGSGRDYTYLQALPVDLWGTDFIVSGVPEQSGNRLRITASTDNCLIYKNDALLSGPLDRGETWETAFPSSELWHLTASSPIQVVLYLGSYQTYGNVGDPASVVITPLDRGICDVYFRNFSGSDIPSTRHYINIISHQDHDAGLLLDGNPLPSSASVSSLGDYRCYHLSLPITNTYQGIHHLSNSDGPFTAYTYGIGSWEGYAYSLGIAIEPQPEPQIHRDTIVLTDSVCQHQIYSDNGFYISSEQTDTLGILIFSDSAVVDTFVHYRYLHLTVLPNASYDTAATIILGDTLFFMGDTLTAAGTYLYHLTAANGCDSAVTLRLDYEDVGLSASADGVCPGDSVTITAHGTHYAYWTASPPDPSLEAQQGQTSITVCPRETTTYSLCSPDGTEVIDLIVVGVEPPPVLCLELSRPFIDFDHPLVVFTDCSEGSSHSTWTFEDGISIEKAVARRQFRHPLADSVGVTLTSCNRYHCCVDTSFFVPSLRRNVWFPNVFTPGEPENNRFGCTVTFEVREFDLYIYTRQGLLVYHTDDIGAPWDGTYEGVPMPQAAYVYYWHVRDTSDYNHTGAGTVTLLR